MVKSNQQTNKKDKQPKPFGKVALAIALLSFSGYQIATNVLPMLPQLGITLPFVSSAVANNNASTAGSRTNERLHELESNAEKLATEIVNGKRYVDTTIPKAPSYTEAPQFNNVMAVFNMVARVGKEGRENAYVYASLKLDDASRREIINVKTLESKELSLDEEIAEKLASIAQFESDGEKANNGSKKSAFLGASGGGSGDELGGLLKGDGSNQIAYANETIEDNIRLGGVAHGKAYLVVNGTAYPSVRTGTTIANRYEVINIDSKSRCVRLSDLKTEDRAELAPVCLY